MRHFAYLSILLIAAGLTGCSTSRDPALSEMARSENEQVTQCSAAMQPVWDQLHALTPEERQQLGLTNDRLAESMKGCYADVLSQGCIDAEASLSSKLDSVNGTSNEAAMLPPCTRAAQEWRGVTDYTNRMAQAPRYRPVVVASPAPAVAPPAAPQRTICMPFGTGVRCNSW
jgi:hypothetical protein